MLPFFQKFKPKTQASQWLIFAMVLWQTVSIYLLAINVLPVWTPWVNFGILSLLVLAMPKSKALQLFILSIPFFIVLPNHYTDTLNMWRPLLVILFARMILSSLQSRFVIARSAALGTTRQSILKFILDCFVPKRPRNDRKKVWSWIKQLHTYEILAVIFFAWCTITLLWAKYPSQGIKQLIFILNAAMIYPVALWAIKDAPLPNPLLLFSRLVHRPVLRNFSGNGRQKSLLEINSLEDSISQQKSKDPVLQRDDNAKFAHNNKVPNLQLTTYNLPLTLAISTGIIIFIGYGQFIASLIFDFYHFWQSWAVNITSLYYGNDFANVASYSNSWLSGNLAGLRMFSVMPSSHAFAMVCVIFIGVLSVLKSYTVTNTSDQLNQKSKVKSQNGNLKIIKFKDFLSDFFKFDIWTLVFVALGIILSGTRGVWVGMIPVLAVTIVLYYRSQYKTQLKTFLASMLLVVIFFSALPMINSSIGHIRNGIQGNLEERASSILDLSESSNAGRLQIWKESLIFASKHPFGVGFGNFITTLNAENKPLDNFTNERNKRYNLPQKYITAHNLYLQILVETSIIGLILFILMWLYYFRHALELSGLKFKISNLKFKINEQILNTTRENLTPRTTSSLALSLILLWCLSYSAFDLTWLNDKILLYTFVIIALISDE